MRTTSPWITRTIRGRRALDLLAYAEEFGDEEDVNYDDGTGDRNFSSGALLVLLSPLGGGLAELTSAHDEALACEAHRVSHR